MDFSLHNSPDLAPVNFPQLEFLPTADYAPIAQQDYRSYGVGAFDFTLQEQFLGGHSGITQDHALNPFSQHFPVMSSTMRNLLAMPSPRLRCPQRPWAPRIRREREKRRH